MADLKNATGLSIGSPIIATMRAMNSQGWSVDSANSTENVVIQS